MPKKQRIIFVTKQTIPIKKYVSKEVSHNDLSKKKLNKRRNVKQVGSNLFFFPTGHPIVK